MEDDRSTLNRYRRKLDQIRTIRESGGHREHEETLHYEINGLWDQMTEEEKSSIRDEQEKNTPQQIVPQPDIQEVPVERESKKPTAPKGRGPWNLN